jgi:hypothetical protein
MRLRLDGRIKPPHARGGWEVQGELQLREELDEEHRRHSRVARVAGVSQYGKAVELALFDAVLVYAAGEWTMTGFERSDPDRGEGLHLQSWYMLPVTAAVLACDARQRQVDEETRVRGEILANFVGPQRPVPPRPRRRHR